MNIGVIDGKDGPTSIFVSHSAHHGVDSRLFKILSVSLIICCTAGIISNIIDYRKKSKLPRGFRQINKHMYKIGIIFAKMFSGRNIKKTEGKLIKSYLKVRKSK